MEEIILKNFEAVAGATATPAVTDLLALALAPLPESLSQASREIAALRGASQAQTEVVATNTQAVWQNTYVQSSGVKSAVADVGKNFSSWWNVMPVVGAFRWLLGGQKEEAPPPVTRYTPPAPARIEAQRVEPQRLAAPQITVQVQAMDSRSFMDHSGDIARAVRDAMLNMHALNDVVSDL